MSKNRDIRRWAAILAVMGLLAPIIIASSVARTEPGPPAVQQGLKPASELALLMREMTAFTDSTRLRLGRSEDLLPYPAHFDRMHTAIPTDGKLDIDHAAFDAFADHYLAQLKGLYDAPKTDRQQVFNGTVQACANCHASACPGPLVRIKKLYVPMDLAPSAK
ncbi:MAG: hypothetical protein IPH53_07960 [Flavobacteriales bacterium]|nr:hypothetical protein [Flavobacteriales bacterium]